MNEWLIALLSGMIVALIATIIIWFLIQKNNQDREKLMSFQHNHESLLNNTFGDLHFSLFSEIVVSEEKIREKER